MKQGGFDWHVCAVRAGCGFRIQTSPSPALRFGSCSASVILTGLPRRCELHNSFFTHLRLMSQTFTQSVHSFMFFSPNSRRNSCPSYPGLWGWRVAATSAVSAALCMECDLWEVGREPSAWAGTVQRETSRSRLDAALGPLRTRREDKGVVQLSGMLHQPALSKRNMQIIPVVCKSGDDLLPGNIADVNFSLNLTARILLCQPTN